MSDRDRAWLRDVGRVYPIRCTHLRLLAGLHDLGAFVTAYATSQRFFAALLDRVEKSVSGDID